MSSLVSGSWHDEMQGVADAINESFGEPLTIIPMTCKPNYPPLPDPTKRPATLTGVFSIRSIETFTPYEKKNQGPGLVRVSTRNPVASFSLKDLPYSISRLYRIRRERDGAVYEITDLNSDGVSRVLLHLVQAGIASDAASEGSVIRQELEGSSS